MRTLTGKHGINGTPDKAYTNPIPYHHSLRPVEEQKWHVAARTMIGGEGLPQVH